MSRPSPKPFPLREISPLSDGLPMIPRTLEPEVMDTVEEARDYDSMDHHAVNVRFVDDLLAFATPSERTEILDVGTGTAQIPVELCQRWNSPDCVNVTAIDLAAEMLRVGEENLVRAGFRDQIKLELVDAKQMPYAAELFQWVISNSIIHHIPDPLAVMQEMRRVIAPRGFLFVRDLLRPESVDHLEEIVKNYAGDANAHQRQMFRESLHAALTLDEVRSLLEQVGFPPGWGNQTTDRHWTIAGQVA